MRESRFWKCCWECADGQYTVWVKSRPRLRGIGASWQEAVDAVCATICDASGDGEPNLSFDPPEPNEGSDASHAHPDWLFLTPEGYIPTTVDADALYSEGYCPHCGDPKGERTDVPLQAEGPGEGDLCWPALLSNRFLPLLCSPRFVDELSPAEKQAFRWIPVTPAKRTRIRYVECVPRRVVQGVALQGWCVSGTRCPMCHSTNLACTSGRSISFGEGQIHDWIDGRDLPAKPKGVVAFGNRHSWTPLLPSDRAKELVRKLRGVRTASIGLAPPDLVIRQPALPDRPRSESRKSSSRVTSQATDAAREDRVV